MLDPNTRYQLFDDLLRRFGAALRGTQLYSREHPIVMRNLEALEVDAGMTRIGLGVAGALARTFPDLVGRPQTALVSIEGDLVVAVALGDYQPIP